MAEKNKKIIQPFIKHDENASQDGKILRLYLDFRKLAKTMSREELESFVSHGAYAIFWRILEFMHGNKLFVEDVEVMSDNLRVDSKFISQILNDYELFRISDGEYISDRLLRDLERQEEKSKSASESARTGWLLSAFNKSYVEFFGEEPILQPEEIESLKKYSEKVPDLKGKLRDILYTLKNLKFDTDVNFKPCANWLLKDNNLARLVNGEFGKLKHKETEKELRERQKQLAIQQAEEDKPSELELEIEKISSRSEALVFIKNYYADKQLVVQGGRAFILPTLRTLVNKFAIADAELVEICKPEERIA